MISYFGVTWQVAGVTAEAYMYLHSMLNQLFDMVEVPELLILQTSMIAADRVFA